MVRLHQQHFLVLRLLQEEQQLLHYLCHHLFQQQLLLNYFFDICNEIGLDKVKDTYKKIFYLLINKFKEGTDFGVVKFIQRDLSFDEIPLECICLLIQEVFPIDNPNRTRNGYSIE